MSANDQNSRDTLIFIPWAPIFCFFLLIVNIIIVFPHLPAKKYQEKLSSIYDLNLFRLNVLQDANAGDSVYNHRIHSRYYSPYSFYNLKVNFPVVSVIRASLFYIITSGVLCISQFPAPSTPRADPRADPRALAFFFALDGKFPGMGNLELSNPPGWGQNDGLTPLEKCKFFDDSKVKGVGLHLKYKRYLMKPSSHFGSKSKRLYEAKNWQ